MNNKDICAIIISYNSDEDILNGIKSVIKENIDIVVVDNGSKTDSIKFLEKISKENNFKLIKNEKNLGIAKALNIGIKYCIECGYTWVLTLDQDSILTENMIGKMFEEYKKLSNKDKVMIIAPEHKEKDNGYDIGHIEKNSVEVLTEITSGNLVKCEVFKKIGFFEEKLFIDLVDHEFCLRLNKEGFKIIKVNNAILLHSLGETNYNNFFGKKVSTSNHSALRRYYMSRNRVYVWKKFKSSFPKWVKQDKKLFISEILRIILFEKSKLDKIKMIFKGINDGVKGVFGAYEIKGREN